jgi:hypothetical protein
MRRPRRICREENKEGEKRDEDEIKQKEKEENRKNINGKGE